MCVCQLALWVEGANWASMATATSCWNCHYNNKNDNNNSSRTNCIFHLIFCTLFLPKTVSKTKYANSKKSSNNKTYAQPKPTAQESRRAGEEQVGKWVCGGRGGRTRTSNSCQQCWRVVDEENRREREQRGSTKARRNATQRKALSLARQRKRRRGAAQKRNAQKATAWRGQTSAGEGVGKESTRGCRQRERRRTC